MNLKQLHALQLSSLLLVLCNPSYANEIYKTVDENGKVSFSDSPRDQKSEAVELKPTNTTPATRYVPVRSERDTKASQSNEYKLSISSPSNDSQIPTGQMSVAVEVSLNRALRDGHRIQLMLNGEKHGQPSESTNMVLSDIYRGSHQLSAAVINSKGKVLRHSAPITIHVQRTKIPQAKPPGNKPAKGS